MEWFELDLTDQEIRRFGVMSDQHGVTPEELMSKVVRQSLAVFERVGARVALGSDSVDTRQSKARSTDPDTSRMAALRNQPRSGTQRGRLLAAIASAGPRGMTAEEASRHTKIRLNSASTRMSELLRGGHVSESQGGTRRTSGGEQAIVYIATRSTVTQADLDRGEELAAAHGWE